MISTATSISAKTHHTHHSLAPAMRFRSPSEAPRDRRIATSMWSLAVWTYSRQKAHRCGDGGRIGAIGHSAISQTAAVLDRARSCGASGGGGSRTHCDDDALAVHGLVQYLPSAERALIIRTAAMASMPDWSPVIPRFRVTPVKGRKGAHKGIYDRHGNLIGHEIDYAGYEPRRAALAVEYAHEVYEAWHEALCCLRRALTASTPLRRWVVTGIGVDAAPWSSLR